MRRSVFSEQTQDKVPFLFRSNGDMGRCPRPHSDERGFDDSCRCGLVIRPIAPMYVAARVVRNRPTLPEISVSSFTFVRASIILPGAEHTSQVDT
jgi:hypothetical protein